MRDTDGVVTPPEEVETEMLLAQGDELLRSSRDLLDQLDEVLPGPQADGAP